MDEPDPSKSNALESSLWELKSLQTHYYHCIAKKSNQVSHSMQQRETPLDELLEIKTTEVSLFFSHNSFFSVIINIVTAFFQIDPFFKKKKIIGFLFRYLKKKLSTRLRIYQ